MIPGALASLECLHAIRMPGDEAVLRPIECEAIVQGTLRDLLPRPVVEHETGLVFYRLHVKAHPGAIADLVADRVLHSIERCVRDRVAACFS